MKLFIILSAVIVATLAEQTCYENVDSSCASGSTANAIQHCNAQYGRIAHIESDIQSYINKQLTTSYQYLKAATFFNSYNRDRPGFVKLFRSLSDKAFEDSIKLIKHITKRGGQIDAKFHEENSKSFTIEEGKSWENSEVTALANALDKEKDLAATAIGIHHKASKTSPDPEISQFLEEEFLSKQSDVIRKLSGYSNDLFNMVKKNANNLPALSIYLFDQYLQKQ